MKRYKIPWEIHYSEEEVKRGIDKVRANDREEAIRKVNKHRMDGIPKTAWGQVGNIR